MQKTRFTRLVSVRLDKEIYEKLEAEALRRGGRRVGGGNYGEKCVTISSLINEYLLRQLRLL